MKMSKEELNKLLSLMLPHLQEYIDKRCLENAKTTIKVLQQTLNEKIKPEPIKKQKSFEEQLKEELNLGVIPQGRPALNEEIKLYPDIIEPQSSSPKVKELLNIEKAETMDFTQFLQKVENFDKGKG